MRKESARTLWPAEEILTVGELKEVLATISNDDHTWHHTLETRKKPVPMVSVLRLILHLVNSKVLVLLS